MLLLIILMISGIGATRSRIDDQIVLENALLTDINGPLIECLNLCVHSVNGTIIGMSGCYNLCQGQFLNITTVHKVPDGQFSFSVNLLCQTDTRMTLKITSPMIPSTYGSPGLYAIEVHSPVHEATYLGTSSIVHTTRLEPQTEYMISGFVISRTNRLEMIMDAKWSTLASTFTPSSVSNITIAAYDLHGDNLSARIQWQVPSAQGCFYEALWHAEDDGAHPQQKQITITSDQTTIQELSIDELRFGTIYQLSIRGISAIGEDAQEEGPLIWMDINTPTCLEWSGYDLEQCAPAVPERLTISEVTNLPRKDHYNIQVTWKMPKVEPSNYTIQLVDMDVPTHDEEEFSNEAHKIYSSNITLGNATSYSFLGIPLYGTHFEVMLVAHSLGGTSAEAFATKFFDKPGSGVRALTPNQQLVKDVQLLTLFLLPVAILAGLSLFGYHVYVKRRKLFEFEGACLYTGHVSMDPVGEHQDKCAEEAKKVR